MGDINNVIGNLSSLLANIVEYISKFRSLILMTIIGLSWANIAYAFNLWEWPSIESEIVNTNIEVVTTPTPIIPKYDLDKLLPTTEKIILPSDYDVKTAGQCVGYIKYIMGDKYSGNAIEWKEYINLDTPEVGSIMVANVGKWGHLGLVLSVDGDKIVVRSRNWRGLWIISDDEFDIDDIRILGFIKY